MFAKLRLEWCLWKSAILGKIFKEAAAEVHSRTFKKDGNIIEDADFEQNLINKLRGFKIKEDGTHEAVGKFEKVEVAYKMATKLKELQAVDIERMDNDDYAKYLVDAINHACS